MKIKEWNELKKNLSKLPPVQRLRFLDNFLKKENNKTVRDEILKEIRRTREELDNLKVWKRTANPRIPSRLIELSQREGRREMPKQESSLEVAVKKDAALQSDDNKGKQYFGSSGEYGGKKYEDITYDSVEKRQDLGFFQRGDYVAGKQEKFGRSESEEAAERMNPTGTETYKKKKEKKW